MNFKQLGEMKNINLSEELKVINASIEKLELKENTLKEVFEKDKNNTSKYYNKKINKIEEEKRSKLSQIRKLEEEEIKDIEIKKEPLLNSKTEIQKQFKLYNIKKNLDQEVEIKYNGWCREEIELLKSEDLELLKIGAFIGRNKNKPINKYDLRIEIYFKNSKLADFFNMSSWRNEILEKSFKTVEDVKNYLNKYYEKYTLELKKLHNKIFEEIEKVEIDILKEFDFNLIKPYSNQWEIKIDNKNKASFINSYYENKHFEVEYLENGNFKISNEENKDELKTTLEYSIYNLTPQIVF